MSTPNTILEDRLRTVEDTLAIYHLIASHPPAADTGTDRYYRNAFAPDGEIDLGGGKGATGNEAIAAIVKTPEHRPRSLAVCVISLDCRGWSSMATQRWQRPICRLSYPTYRVRHANFLAMAPRPAFASTGSAPIVGNSSVERMGGK